MKRNMGFADKLIRLIAAVVILALYFLDVINGTLAIVLLVVAGIFVLTSLINFCPLYWPFGISTSGKKKEE